MDYIVYGIAKSQTRLSSFHFHFLFPFTSSSKTGKIRDTEIESTRVVDQGRWRLGELSKEVKIFWVLNAMMITWGHM